MKWKCECNDGMGKHRGLCIRKGGSMFVILTCSNFFSENERSLGESNYLFNECDEVILTTFLTLISDKNYQN